MFRSIIVIILLVRFTVLFFFFQNGDRQCIELQKHLEQYRSIDRRGGWPLIPSGKSLSLGSTGKRVGLLKQRLMISGELSPSPIVSDTFDLALDSAVRKFQQYHSIAVSGTVGPTTLRELNIPVIQRIRQIQNNLDKWRELQDNDRYSEVIVNIANGTLELVRNDSSIIKMKIIVGRSYRETPLFSSHIESIEFNPCWIIPPGIFRKDILPKLKRDPYFISDNDMYVTCNGSRVESSDIDWTADSLPCHYVVIQNPGPKNPLGVVRFTFPNSHFIYMHDTPDKELFSAPTNMFSSGCIRLSDAVSLANVLLKADQGWQPMMTDSVIRKGKTTTIKLKEPVRIHICYFTVWVDKEGALCFGKDVYKVGL